MRTVLFFHGLESGPMGGKTIAMQEAGYSVVAPDMQKQDLCHRVEIAVASLMNHLDATVVGSSFGGLTALLAQESVIPHSMVLCAPALRFGPNISNLIVNCPTIIIHGVQDDICPIEWSREFAKNRNNVKLVEVQDGHRLSTSHREILNAIKELRSKHPRQ